MDCMQLQDRREKNFLLDNEVPTMDDSIYYPQEITTRLQSKQTSEITRQNSYGLYAIARS